MLKNKPTERQEHLALMDWVKLNPIVYEYLIHIPNEYDGGAIRGKIRQMMGVKRGVSDFFYPRPNKRYSGLWIELKRIGGVATKEQTQWLIKMKSIGYSAHIAYGCIDAIEIIKDYMSNI